MRTAEMTTTRIALKNILFATDFSQPAEMALPYALAIARQYGAKLHLAHVLTPDAWRYAAPEVMPETRQELERKARAELRELAESQRFRGIAHETVLAEGDLWERLREMVRERNIDLIVVGTQGRSGVQRLLLGSSAEEIFRLAERPVLTVGPEVAAEPSGELHRILYATDFSPQAEAALPYALSLAQENNAELIMVHILPDFLRATLENTETANRAYMKQLQALVPPDAEPWCRPEFVVEFGDAAEGILKVAAELKADLIVLGVRPGGSMARARTHGGRAVAYKVVSHAACPVLTVRG